MKLILETQNPKLLALIEALARELGINISRMEKETVAPDVKNMSGKEVVVKNSEKAVQALKKLTELGAFKDIKDPVEWQRGIRKDRPLPGRDD